jgi:hypothetical protein
MLKIFSRSLGESPAQRLVEEQHPRIGAECKRQLELAALAVGEKLYGLVGVMLQSDRIKSCESLRANIRK